MRAIALRCGQVCGLGLYGLDVVESQCGPVVVDVNYFPGYKGVPDVAPRIADYIDQYARGHYGLRWPALEPDHAMDALRDAAEADVRDRLVDQPHARVTHAH